MSIFKPRIRNARSGVKKVFRELYLMTFISLWVIMRNFQHFYSFLNQRVYSGVIDIRGQR